MISRLGPPATVTSVVAPRAYKSPSAPLLERDSYVEAPLPLPLLENIVASRRTSPCVVPTEVSMRIPSALIGGISGCTVWLAGRDKMTPLAVREASVVPQGEQGILSLTVDSTLNSQSEIWLMSEHKSFSSPLLSAQPQTTRPISESLDLSNVIPINPAELKPPDNVLKALRQAKRILVVSHTPPDGDSIGSALGLRRTLENMGKKADFLMDGPMPGWMREQTSPEECRNWDQVQNQNYDLVVMVDVAQTSRIGRARELVDKSPQLVVIDHHQVEAPQVDCPVHSWIQPADAAALLVASVAECLGPDHWQGIAAPLVTGVLTDTGRLENNLRSETKPMLKHLLYARGDGNLALACQRLESRLPEEAKGLLMSPARLQGELLRGADEEIQTALSDESKSYHEELGTNLGLVVVPRAAQDLATRSGIAADAQTNPTDLQDALYGRLDELARTTPLAVMLLEREGGVQVSIRSQDPQRAIALAQSLGGGGKPGIAAAFSPLPLSKLQEVVRGWGAQNPE